MNHWDSWKNITWRGYAAFLCLPLFFVDLWVQKHFGWLAIPDGFARSTSQWYTAGFIFLLLVPIFAGAALTVWSSEIARSKWHREMEKRSDEITARLIRLKNKSPPDDEVLEHLRQLGYYYVVEYVKNMERKLGWRA